MRVLPRRLTLGLALSAAVFLAPGRAADGAFTAPDFPGWELVTPEKAALASVCHALPDGSVAVDGKPVGYLQTTASFENFRLHAEWRWTDKAGNSGVLVHIASGPVDRNLWPRCFQIQTKNTRVGDLLPMAGVTFAEKLSTPPDAKTPQLNRTAADSERPVGEWNACDVVCRDGTIEVTVNGVLQNRVTGCAPAAGRVGFQLEGTPYELRAVRLEPLSP